MMCNHPEEYVSIMGRYKVCNLCGAKLQEGLDGTTENVLR